MRILQINSVAAVGSTGRIAEGIGKSLLANGHESIVAYGRRAGPSHLKLVRIGTDFEIYLHGLKSLFLDRHGRGSKRATQAFLSRILKLKPDLVHLHNIHGYYLNYPLLFEFLAKFERPVVWTFHDSWPFTGHCAHFVRVDCLKWRTACHTCPLTRAYPTALIDNSQRNFQDKKTAFGRLNKLTIVAPSDWLREHVKQSFFQAVDCLTINNGIDLETFQPLRPKNAAPIILGVASTWTASKGLHDFVTLRQLLPAHYKIVLIGLSPRQSRGLPEGLVAIEKTDSARELADWYSQAAVFVNPTYSDTFPTVNLESLACGTPVVTYQTGGSPEAISPETGAVVTTGDVAQLAATTIHWVESNSPERFRACRLRAEQRFSDRVRFQEYVQLYQRLLN